jgi:YNFM family putative membrane transporter
MSEPGLAAARPRRIGRNTPEFRRTAFGLGAGGFATFALLYCVQPLLPAFAQEFDISPAESSLAISVSTVLLAVSTIVAASLSEAIGRRGLMIGALAASAFASLLIGFASEWWQVVALRALIGVTLSGLPAAAMAYLADEMEPDAIGLAMGLYIGGNGVGGMSGRLAVAALADWGSWRVGLVAIGVFGLVSAALFWWALPPSRHFRPQRLNLISLARGLGAECRDRGLQLLIAEAFIMMGVFVTTYNYIGFRLMAPPFELSQTVVGLIFIVYLFGSVSSAAMGGIATRFGRRRVFPAGLALMTAGLALTAFDNLAAIVAGMAALTAGMFGAHSVASSWVGLRASARGRAQASAMYLMCYYLGGGVCGWLGGYVWAAGGWPALIAATLALAAFAFVGAALLNATPPRAQTG